MNISTTDHLILERFLFLFLFKVRRQSSRDGPSYLQYANTTSFRVGMVMNIKLHASCGYYFNCNTSCKMCTSSSSLRALGEARGPRGGAPTNTVRYVRTLVVVAIEMRLLWLMKLVDLGNKGYTFMNCRQLWALWCS